MLDQLTIELLNSCTNADLPLQTQDWAGTVPALDLC